LNAIVKNNASVACEWAENLPENWEFRLLKRDFVVTLGKMLQSVQHNETETEECYLRSANLRWEGVDITDVRKMWFAPQEKKKLALQYGDLLVSEGGDVGRTSFWQNELSNCYIQNAINRVRARKKDSTRFLYYWLHLIKSIGYIDAVVSRITIAHLTAEKLERILSIKPPIPVQHRIAAYLDKTCAAIDKAIEAKQKQLGILDALRKSIIHNAVTRGLDDSVELKDSRVEWIGRIPRNWDVRRIKDIVALNSGDSITSDSITPSGNYPVFGGNGLRGFTTSYTHDGYYVLIGRQGALCGNINYAEGKFWASEHAVVATTLTRHDIFWLGELLCVMNLNQYSNAAAQPGLAVEKIKFLRLPVPSYEEQQLIALFVKDKIIRNEELVSNLQKQISTLEQYRKSLIHECVTGKRRITEGDVQGKL
jgi:type I restriction enzyme S subunit